MKLGVDRHGRRSRRYMVTGIAFVFLYFLAFAAMYLLGGLMEKSEPAVESYGNLDERFVPQLMLEFEGKSYSHFDSYYTNLLIIGVDQPEFNSSAGQRGGGQADFLLLLSISRKDRTITPIHIDRDTIADVQVYGAFGDPIGTQRMQICLAHAFGNDQASSSENTLAAVSTLLGGIRIDDYLTMDMDSIAALNDALGGVTVTLEEDFSAIDPEMVKGTTIRLEGRQAEYYVRGRYGIGDYTNRQRMLHQQTFIDAAIPLLYQKLTEDPSFLVTLYDHMSPHLCTSIERNWLANQSFAIEHYEIRDIQTLPGSHVVGEDGFMEFYPDQDTLDSFLIRIFYQQTE